MTTPPEPPAGDAWQNAPRMNPESPGPPPPGGHGYPPGYGGQQARGTSNGMGIAALVLGIIGLLSSFFIIGGLFGLLAVIFGVIGRGKAKRGQASNGGMALTGLILGVLALLIAIFVGVILGMFADELGGYADCVEQAQTQAEIDQCKVQFEESVQ